MLGPVRLPIAPLARWAAPSLPRGAGLPVPIVDEYRHSYPCGGAPTVISHALQADQVVLSGAETTRRDAGELPLARDCNLPSAWVQRSKL